VTLFAPNSNDQSGTWVTFDLNADWCRILDGLDRHLINQLLEILKRIKVGASITTPKDVSWHDYEPPYAESGSP
jgi:hypothetical protein